MFLDSQKVKALRDQKGYTQAQLAELCDLSARTIQRVERDGIASQETTSALAAVFEIQRTQLFFQDQPNTNIRPSNGALRVAMTSGLGGMVVGILITFIWFKF